MFAGIVEGVGRVVGLSRAAAGQAGAMRLELDAGGLLDELPAGASVSINGVCLTLVGRRAAVAAFDVVAETLRQTTLGELRAGDRVNLERSLRVGDRIDGHFVQGHVDGIGTIERIDSSGGQWLMFTRAPDELRPYIVRKGSIAIDGVSLTIAAAETDVFSVALIPATLDRTVLGERRAGQRVNLESDVIARLVVANLARSSQAQAEPHAVSWELLRESGLLT